MADLIIRGMEMPRNCLDCKIRGSRLVCPILDRYAMNNKANRGTNCPLVPLPAGHGRLIDADAFEDAFIRYYLSQERKNHLVFTPVEIKQHMADMMGDWPTIVPAEGGGGEC